MKYDLVILVFLVHSLHLLMGHWNYLFHQIRHHFTQLSHKCLNFSPAFIFSVFVTVSQQCVNSQSQTVTCMYWSMYLFKASSQYCGRHLFPN